MPNPPLTASGSVDPARAEVLDAAAEESVAGALAPSGADLFLLVIPRVITDAPGFLGLNGRSHLALSVFLFDAEGKLAGRGDTYTEQLVTSAGDVGQYKAVLALASDAAAKLIAKF